MKPLASSLVITQAGLTLLISLILAVSVNQFRPHSLAWVGNWTTTKQAAVPEDLQVTPQEALRLLDKPDVVFLDARSPEAFAQEHLPGAINLPYDPFALDTAEHIAVLPKYKVFLVYCDGVGCPLSSDLAQLMRLEGLDKVLVLSGGLAGWKAAGGSVE